MSSERLSLERLDRLLGQLGLALEVPGDEWDGSPESTWQKLDRLETAMGADALGAMREARSPVVYRASTERGSHLRRQGVPRAAVDEALAVLARRRGQGPGGG